MRDHHAEGIGDDHGITVAKFGGHFDVHREAGHAFNEEFAEQAGVIGGAAGDGEEARDGLVIVGGEVEAAEVAGAIFEVQAAAQSVGDSAGLFHDFFEQEVVVAGLLDGGQLEFDLDLLVLLGLGLKVDHGVTAGAADGDFIVIQIHHAVGVADDGSGIGGNVGGFGGESEQQRAAAAGGHDGVGVAVIEHH